MMKSDSDIVQPGDIIKNRYRILDYIGGGGQSRVYIAEDTEENSRKVIVKALVFQSFSKLHREEELKLFSREAEVFGKITHPLIPKLYDFVEENGKYYIVEEFIEGKSLEKLIKLSPEPMDSRYVLIFLSKMLELLQVFHSQNPPIIVRDIKPNNIIFDNNTNPHLIDISIAREHKPGKGDTVRMGSPGYAPPEQYKGMTDPRSDIYSLGATAYQMITRFDPAQKPFSLPDIEEVNPNADPELARIIQKAIAMDPEDRYQSAKEMKADVDRALAAILNKNGDPIRSRQIKRIIVFIASLIILVFTAFAGMQYLQNYLAQRQEPVQKALTCGSNLFEIGIALDKYAQAHNGIYPEKLSDLIPEYLSSIPTCPEAGKDTYSDSYRIIEEEEKTPGKPSPRKIYLIYCKGHYHRKANLDPDHPRLEKGRGIR